jgi:hypothetical protein
MLALKVHSFAQPWIDTSALFHACTNMQLEEDRPHIHRSIHSLNDAMVWGRCFMDAQHGDARS